MFEADEVFVFPTTVRQQGFWYLDQLQPGNPAYNIAVRFRLQGCLRVEVLERALNEIVRRHEVAAHRVRHPGRLARAGGDPPAFPPASPD